MTRRTCLRRMTWSMMTEVPRVMVILSEPQLGSGWQSWQSCLPVSVPPGILGTGQAQITSFLHQIGLSWAGGASFEQLLAIQGKPPFEIRFHNNKNELLLSNWLVLDYGREVMRGNNDDSLVSLDRSVGGAVVMGSGH